MHARAHLLVLVPALTLTAACAHVRPSCPRILASVEQPVPAATPAPVCPAPRDYPWTNLVLEGGGVKGIAYAGAFEVLERQGVLSRVERVAGTSAGSIQAALLALGYTPQEIRSLLFNLDLRDFEDGGATGLFRLFRRFGWFDGDYFLGLMRCLVAKKTGGRPQATFADLRELGLPDLHVFATDLNTGEAKEFSAETTPDHEVALAVRTSGSFPLFFAAIEEAGDVFVDGGVLRNYPVDAFDGPGGLNKATLGFVLENTGAPPPHRPVGGIVEYAEALFETLWSCPTENGLAGSAGGAAIAAPARIGAEGTGGGWTPRSSTTGGAVTNGARDGNAVAARVSGSVEPRRSRPAAPWGPAS